MKISQVNFPEVSGLILGSRSKLVNYEMQGGGLRLAALCNHLYITVTSLPVLRNHFDTVPVPVLTSYFPSYGSGSLHYLLKKILSIIFLLKLDGNELILTWNSLICSPFLIPFKTIQTIIKAIFGPFLYLEPDRNRHRNLEKDHASGSDRGKIIPFRFRLRLRNTFPHYLSLRCTVQLRRPKKDYIFPSDVYEKLTWLYFYVILYLVIW